MNRQRPRLKNGVDLQLQSAFSDGNWPVVVRLAEKRARTFNDQYYEILKVCAESQLDDPTAKFTAVAAVQQYIKDGTVVKDVDAIDLLEWATMGLTEEDDFLDTLGPLRVRAVKASPKDMTSATRSLESCIVHWDLVSAQQIAATMDRSFPQERKFMFWNIATTHLLSISPRTPPDKRKLYGTLAQRQVERAAQATEQATSENDKHPARSIQTEEEILLLYDIVETHGSDDDFKKLLTSAVFCPLQQFRLGRKELLVRVLAKHRRENDSEAIFRLCKDALSQGDEAGTPTLLASDLAIWEDFIAAAAQIQSVDETAPKTVQNLLLRLIKSPKLPPIYKKNLLMARLRAAFQLALQDGDDSIQGQPSSTRLRELINYIQDQGMNLACFDDIKSSVEQLDRSGIKHLMQNALPRICGAADDEKKAQRLQLLFLKLRYFVITCPLNYTTIPGSKPRFTCTTCGGESGSQSCPACFTDISHNGLEQYQKIAAQSPDSLSTDYIPADLMILVAFCSIKLADPRPDSPCSAFSADSFRHIFHAVLLLERQLAFSPKNSQLLLVLLQLHILVGSAPRSRHLFEELTVKRTTMDSLGPLFYDRLTTVAPALLSPSDNLGYQFMDMLANHYNVSLKLRMPRRLIDAFEAESYSSVLDIPKYITDLRNSCTRVMSLVEEVRSERMLGCPTWELLTDVRFIEVTDDIQLRPVIDYGSFPSWDSSSRAPVYARLRLGPIPTNRRMHLSLLAEAFHDVLGYKPPSVYKVPVVSSPSDQAFVRESLGQISNSLTRFLPNTDAEFTSSEFVYFELISLLSMLILFSVDSGSHSAGGETVAGQIVSAVEAALETLQSHVPSNSGSSVEGTVSLLTNLHSVGIYREAAEAVSVASRWILDFNAKEKERDRSGQSNLPKDIVANIKALQASAAAALKQGKGWIVGLKTQVKAVDFQSRFKTWVFPEASGEIRGMVEDDFVADLVAHMRENVEGWQLVKWD